MRAKSQDDGLPPGVLVAFYGDDFTGSSAVMEVLTFAGLPAVMFLDVPDHDHLARFEGYRAIGIAGVARSRSPEWMEHNLPRAFASLEQLGAPVNHYKICSTLDSSPDIGSIGRALELGVAAFCVRDGAAGWQPLIVAAPGIRRYQAFGNLFAVYEGVGYRLDRHPVMMKHPVTPMRESDVRIHLRAQTPINIGLIDFVSMMEGGSNRALRSALEQGQTVVALDVVDETTLAEAGRLIWEGRGSGIFVVGSQGVEYALVAHWRKSGLLKEEWQAPTAGPVEKVVAASGSVSPLTASQISWAQDNGFEVVAVDASKAVSETAWTINLASAVASAKLALSNGRSPILVTARGPDDPAVREFESALAASPEQPAAVKARVGAGLGSAVRQLLVETGIRRVVISGGDTSGYATSALGAYALTATSPLAPGCALCRVCSDDPEMDGIEIALKGGQMGGEDFFGRVRSGGEIQHEEYAK